MTVLILYHGTNRRLLDDVLQHGLRPAYRGQRAVPEAVTRATDFTVTTHYETAEYYAAQASKIGEALVLEYHVTWDEVSKYLYRGRPQTWDYIAVPPGHIQYALKRSLPSRFLVATHEGAGYRELARIPRNVKPLFRRPAAPVRVRSYRRRR